MIHRLAFVTVRDRQLETVTVHSYIRDVTVTGRQVFVFSRSAIGQLASTEEQFV